MYRVYLNFLYIICVLLHLIFKSEYLAMASSLPLNVLLKSLTYNIYQGLFWSLLWETVLPSSECSKG